MKYSARPLPSAGSLPMQPGQPEHTAVKILYTPRHDQYLEKEIVKHVETFIANDATEDQVDNVMGSSSFKELVRSEAVKLLATLEPSLQRGFNEVAKSFTLAGANGLRDLVERKMPGSKSSWGAAVAFFVFAGEAQLKGKAKNLARTVWMDTGLAQHPVATSMACPNCRGSARLTIHLRSNAPSSIPERWEIACPACQYRDLSLPESPRVDLLNPASEVQVRRWITTSPAIADPHPFMLDRREQLLTALKGQLPMLRSGIQSELTRFASEVQKEIAPGRPTRRLGHGILFMHNRILATDLSAGKVRKLWPPDYSTPSLADKVVEQAGTNMQVTLDDPAESFDQHWHDQFERRLAKLRGALERDDVLESAVQAYALKEDAWHHGLVAPFTLTVRLQRALAVEVSRAEATPLKPTLPAPSMQVSSSVGFDIEDLSNFLAAAINSMAANVNPAAIAALLKAYLAMRK